MAVRRLRHLLAATAVAAFALPLAAHAFPTKPVDIIVWVTPGGSHDLVARTLGKSLEKRWKVPIRVINKPGGNTVPAIQEMMSAPADGHTVLLDSQGSTSLLALVVPNVPYKLSDRTFLTMIATSPMIFAVGANSPFKTLDDVAKAFKANPAGTTWTAIGGVGTIDIAFRKLFRDIGVEFGKTRPMLIKGGADAAVQAAGGHVGVAAGSYQSFSPFIANQRVRLLAVAAETRQKRAPDVPTTTELGYKGVHADTWMGLSTAPKVPAAAVAAWETALRELKADQAFVDDLAKLGVEPLAGGAKEMRAFVEAEERDMQKLFAQK